MIIEEIRKRRSVREFKQKAVSDALISEIIKAAQFAPSARNNRSIEFVVIRNQGTKEIIFNICGQEFVREAPVLIVPVVDTTKTNCSIEDLAVASENMFLEATALGLGTVWKSLKKEFPEEKKLKKLLGIPERYKAINIIPVGYPQHELEPHTEAEFCPEKIHRENW